MSEEQTITLSLLRCANYNPTLATRWQMIRLYNCVKEEDSEFAEKILRIIAEGPHQTTGNKLHRS